MLIYGIQESGNCYKPCLLLAHLGGSYDWIEVDTQGGESRSEHFRRMNPHGKTPVLELDDGRHLFESNAILCYLADGTPWLPQDRYQRARTLAWMFFEQNSLETPIGAPHHWRVVMKDSARHAEEFARRSPQGVASLTTMERYLADSDWFGGERMTVADIALYGFAHVAGEAGYDMMSFPRTQAWLARVAAQPRHLPMERMGQGLAG